MCGSTSAESDHGDNMDVVDIGTMSLPWHDNEATSDNGWMYDCTTTTNSDRSAIQINVSTDGILMVTKKGGSANACVDAIRGLTIDQLRWMYSSYTTEQLMATG